MCPALICPQRSPSLSVCQKPGLVVFFVSFESQPSVCSFNCAQTPFSSGESGRGGLIRVAWQKDCSDCVKPVWSQTASQVPLMKEIHDTCGTDCEPISTSPALEMNLHHYQEFHQHKPCNTSAVSQYTLTVITLLPRVPGKSLSWKLSFTLAAVQWLESVMRAGIKHSCCLAHWGKRRPPGGSAADMHCLCCAGYFSVTSNCSLKLITARATHRHEAISPGQLE